MALLVTGGAGYIGSHMVLSLLEKGHEVVVLDNLVNSSKTSLHRVEKLTGKQLLFIEGDLRDSVLLDQIFSDHKISEVLHFAGLKSVGQSVCNPLRYYEYNVAGTISLCKAMHKAGVRKLVFSSSATVYGDISENPVHEGVPTGIPTNPYGYSKLMVENVLKDLVAADESWSVAILRYFNPVGAHESGCIGEDPRDTPNNLVPYISQVAIGRRQKLSIYGNDYPTPDGTGIRDYIHVMDLVEGHICAMAALSSHPGLNIWNLGTGQGYSVMEVVSAFERVSGKRIPYEIVARRSGDIAECWADATKAKLELCWHAKRDLVEMMKDNWKWQRLNPNGFR